MHILIIPLYLVHVAANDELSALVQIMAWQAITLTTGDLDLWYQMSSPLNFY